MKNEVGGERDVADTGEFRDVYKIFVGSLKGKRLLEDREGMVILKWKGVDYIDVTRQDGI